MNHGSKASFPRAEGDILLFISYQHPNVAGGSLFKPPCSHSPDHSRKTYVQGFDIGRWKENEMYTRVTGGFSPAHLSQITTLRLNSNYTLFGLLTQTYY